MDRHICVSAVWRTDAGNAHNARVVRALVIKLGAEIARWAWHNRVDIRIHNRVVAVFGLQRLPSPELRCCLIAQPSVVGHDEYVDDGALIEKQLHLRGELGNVLIVWNSVGRRLVAKRIARNATQVVASRRTQVPRRIRVRPWRRAI